MLQRRDPHWRNAAGSVTVGISPRSIWGNTGGRSRPGDLAPPADRAPRPHVIGLHDFPTSLRRGKSANVPPVAAEPEGRGQIGELRGARAARPGSAYHEKITADHSRLRPIRLGCSRPDSPAGTSAPSAQEFVNKVAISDMFEIQSSPARAIEAG